MAPVNDAEVADKVPTVAEVEYRLVRVAPVAERFVVLAFRIVAVPVVFVFVNVAPTADKFVVDALVKVAFVINPFVKLRPVPEIAVVLALVSATFESVV